MPNGCLWTVSAPHQSLSIRPCPAFLRLPYYSQPGLFNSILKVVQQSVGHGHYQGLTEREFASPFRSGEHSLYFLPTAELNAKL